jgi:ABC-2 type transport system permease protein
MSRAFSSELLKMRTTRTFFALALSAIGLTFAIVILFALAAKESDLAYQGSDVLGFGGLAQIFALIIGILAVTTEFRHGTITPSLMVVPSRSRLVLAKLGAALLVGLVLGLVCEGLGDAITLLLVDARGIDPGVTAGDFVGSVVGGSLAVALYAAFGVGLGAVVRNQVGAIVGGLVYLFVLEPALTAIPTVGDWIDKYGLSGAGNALAMGNASDDNTLSQVPGGLLLVLYAAIFVAAGIALLRRRDISA